MSDIELSFHIVAAVGSILSGLIMLITFIRVVTRLTLKPEVIYGGEARIRFENLIDKKLKSDDEIDSYTYEGGKNKIVPRLEIEKCNYNSLLMKKKFKKCKKRVRFFDKKGNEVIVRTWYLK